MQRLSAAPWVLAGLLTLLGASDCRGQETKAGTTAPGWSLATLPGSTANRTLQTLQREPLQAPLRMRVWVVPGSGCSGLGPFADRYFSALIHAEIRVLHKPGVTAMAQRAPQECDSAFVASDALSAWRDDVRKALQAGQAQAAAGQASPDEVPQWLVGLSEGGEVVPLVADAVRNLQGVVLVASAGLAPAQVAGMKAQQDGHGATWERLIRQAAGPQDDATVVQGRTLRYWRDLLTWPSESALHAGPWPLLHVWGGRDDLVPPAAARRFAALQATRSAPYCAWEMSGADHGLQGPQGFDGVPRVWVRLERWARTGRMPCE